MPKAKLTMQSISFLVETYEDKTNTYRFVDIQKMIEEKFKIKVTSEGVRKAYHRHKDDANFKPKEVIKTKEKGSAKAEDDTITAKVSKPIIPMSQRRAMKNNLIIDSGKKEYKSITEDMDEEAVLGLFSSQDQ